ncbi:cytochrome c-type biogenesis protein CcmH [Duganella sp. CF402]|uniref:cytochrome c-type biogenesis protein n=1 Tax=unclassified Duganella TaxID=2636909 RepID=UPI0008AFC13A|nr:MULTISPECIES: cytochrome c-type biogenesis protein [unclassified Duganella]RZT06285.1 cytochrome c-type biogenesis protein CcmH [Duganella sp. BK701]SEM69139.1 cytochrome c-type biogenesis protein CcmH [Duganella sp. CF402]
MAKWIAAVLMTIALNVHATEDLDKRAAALEEELRCLVCQNQTIADSHAGLAADLRREVREQLAQGKSEQEVLDFMVQRYGDFVLYRPPVKSTTWLLWFGPFLLLLAGALLLVSRLRAARSRDAGPQPSEEELQRARALLDNDKEQP